MRANSFHHVLMVGRGRFRLLLYSNACTILFLFYFPMIILPRYNFFFFCNTPQFFRLFVGARYIYSKVVPFFFLFLIFGAGQEFLSVYID